MHKHLFGLIAMGVFGAACSTTSPETARRFDKDLYQRSQEPELAAVDQKLQRCADNGPMTVNWQVAGDGHIEDVKIAEPKAYDEKMMNCVRAEAYKAQFTAPANNKPVVVSREIGNTVIAGEAASL